MFIINESISIILIIFIEKNSFALLCYERL